MGLRPGRCYKRLQRPYTRTSVHVPKKGYVKGVPRHKIAQFEMGKLGNYDFSVFLIAKSDVQVRHNALESSRVSAAQTMEKVSGKESGFFFKVRVYPHHVIRENAMATGAGADRFQQGMRQSFGKPIGTAARVMKGQKIFEIRTDKDKLKTAKLALKRAAYKLPVQCSIITQSNMIAESKT